MDEKSAAPEEAERIKKDVRSSLLIVLPLTLLAFAFSPGLLAASTFGIDLGPLSPEEAPLLFAGIELSLALAMLLACKSILVRGVRLLFKSPCADSLIAVSAISAVIASLLLMVQMMLTGEALFHQLLFTPLGLFLTFTLGGKYLEVRLAARKLSLDEDEGVMPPGAEEMMAEHEAEHQRREEEERRKKESEARYRELEALRAEEPPPPSWGGPRRRAASPSGKRGVRAARCCPQRKRKMSLPQATRPGRRKRRRRPSTRRSSPSRTMLPCAFSPSVCCSPSPMPSSGRPWDSIPCRRRSSFSPCSSSLALPHSSLPPRSPCPKR